MASPNPRALWRPKCRAVDAQCASCPFLAGNNAEFGEVVTRLLAQLGRVGTANLMDIAFARERIKRETKQRGDFLCHGTVYDEAMMVRPPAEFRQCAGATKYYREHHPR